MITTTIAIIGKICSGKSTIARRISANLDLPIISFGAYLTRYSKDNNLPTDRVSLQNLGNHFIKEDSGKFLRNVILFQPIIPDSMIIEGVRHLSIQKELADISNKSIFIFVEAPIKTRYDRYCSRIKESDKIVSYEEFLVIDNHVVESEIDLLKSKCQITSDTGLENNEDLFKQLAAF
jgi:cytidylate kinase